MRPGPGPVTVIVHGTFAAEQRWWRLGGQGEPTFADRLEVALSESGVSGSVWRPVLEVGLGYDDFRWSGENRHRARVAGGRKLARSLDRMAQAARATPRAPLAVNLVAHSHGGNVALEALRHLSDAVRPISLVMLGTPLLRRRAAMRMVRVLLGLALLAAVISLVVFAFAQLLGFFGDRGPGPWRLLGAAALVVLSAGWLLLLAGDLVDALLRPLIMSVGHLSGHGGEQAYGPTRRQLARLMATCPVVMFTSHQDEADLLLQLGSAPRRLYREWVHERWSWPGRLVELVFVRPWVEGLGLRVLSVFLERFVLGFSWPSLLFWDYEMADLDRGDAYPAGLLRRVDVTEHLLDDLRERQGRAGGGSVLPVVREVEGVRGVARRSATLRSTLMEVARGIERQVRLRHSGYYTSQEVVSAVAAVLSESSAAWAAASRATGTRNGEQET